MDINIIDDLFNSSKNDCTSCAVTEDVQKEIDSALFKSFNEAEDEAADEESSETLDWGVDENDDSQEDDSEAEITSSDEEEETSENEDTNEEEVENEDSEQELNENGESSDTSDGEIAGVYSEIKDELDAERETLGNIYERFFDGVVEPLFRKLEDSNINVSFDTTELLSQGVIRIELSHRNSDSSAEMQINIFANTVNGEFLGMENADGEAISTALDNVSLDDLIDILIKVLED